MKTAVRYPKRALLPRSNLSIAVSTDDATVKAVSEAISTSDSDQLVSLTDEARAKISAAMSKEGREGSSLRLAVNKGGCSGYEYSIKFVDNGEADDLVFSIGDIRVLVAADSLAQLKGTVLDYSDGIYGAGLKFVNPNATHSCGCGASFTTG